MPARWKRGGKRRFSRRPGRKSNSALAKRRRRLRSGRRRENPGGAAPAENEMVTETDDEAVAESRSETETETGSEAESGLPGAAGLPDAFQISELEKAAIFEEGYRQGIFEGGEARLGRMIPRFTLLPYLTLDDVIRAGLGVLSASLVPLMTPADVYKTISNALAQKKPFSLVRVGDGELLTLAHDTFLPWDQALHKGPFLPYAGVQLPNPAAREALAASLRMADLVGVPESRHPSFQGLLFPVLRHYGMEISKLRLTTSTINYALNEAGLLHKLLKENRLLLIGNAAPSLAGWLAGGGYTVAGVISPVNGIADVDSVMERVRAVDFDLALVAAGVAAVIICPRISSELGKVAFDFGHLADKLVTGEVALIGHGEVYT
ncbi:GT-D fold domain-containing glycosyltransferase [Paenibacillus sp. M1]|uniref:GT-D fold domain-containing glycosyltransferase n=1 Tax=Paenibacillus haidiansis TaxID=1574488 RepID=A0ABU7VW48_9BACL